MTLFRPFRSTKDFEKEGTRFDVFFQRWFETEAPPTAHTFVKDNTDYYTSRGLLTTQNDPDIDRYFRCQDGDDELEYGSVQDILDSDEDNQTEIEEYNLSDEFVNAPIQPTKNIDMLEKSNICSSLAAFSTINSSLPIGNFTMSIDDVEKRMRDEATVPSFASNPSLLDIYPDLPTRVKLLQIAVKNIEHPTQSEPVTHHSNPAELQDFPSLQKVSLTFQLNEKQNKMFAKIGTDLLTSCLVGHDPEKQTIGFLGGLPGAGKSRVIGSIQSLADEWKSSDAAVTAAYQGVAAQAANGKTIHKLFGWSVNKRKRWTPTTARKERFAKVKLFILDEISTCDIGILGKVDATPRILLNCPDKLFGGIHVLFVGDWLQQLPVAGQPAFLSSGEILSSSGRPKKDTPEYLDRIRGITAFRALN
ncbi:unnamed protein product [Phytophthora fragariaefolia]|uniref:ATP-dependent DNA helicase n=1 Tax=Phytophthora fragariaefolia TaxID=1490495 RepID=A0A9W6WTB3_9STRA|nr:unnamed protein product [Phytophthora fragariaefolia]